MGAAGHILYDPDETQRAHKFLPITCGSFIVFWLHASSIDESCQITNKHYRGTFQGLPISKISFSNNENHLSYYAPREVGQLGKQRNWGGGSSTGKLEERVNYLRSSFESPLWSNSAPPHVDSLSKLISGPPSVLLKNGSLSTARIIKCIRAKFERYNNVSSTLSHLKEIYFNVWWKYKCLTSYINRNP